LGDTLWTKSYGDVGKNKFNDVTTTSTNELLFTGSKTTIDGDTDFWVVKTDPVGNELWQYAAGDSLNDEATKIIEGNDGNYYFVGTSNSITGTKKDIIVHKLSPSGVFLNQFLFNNANDEEGSFILQYVSNDNFFIGGNTNSVGLGEQDIYYSEVDGGGYIFNGNSLTAGTSSNDLTADADTTYDHGFIIVGTTEGSINGISSIFVIKIDSLFQTANELAETVDITSIPLIEKAENDLILYPNPASQYLHIEQKKNLRHLDYLIYNLLGQPIQKGIITDNYIYISNLPKGMYHLIISDNTDRHYTFTKK